MLPMTPSRRTKRSTSDNDKIIGERIMMFRKSLGLTQGSLGKRVGVTFQQIQKYEKGVNKISATQLTEFSSALKVSVRDLLPDGRRDNPPLLATLDSETIKLIRLFAQIKDKATRKTILNIVSSFQR
jgi:transcriptional regulator with XRE-family HTH domain